MERGTGRDTRKENSNYWPFFTQGWPLFKLSFLLGIEEKTWKVLHAAYGVASLRATLRRGLPKWSSLERVGLLTLCCLLKPIQRLRPWNVAPKWAKEPPKGPLWHLKASRRCIKERTALTHSCARMLHPWAPSLGTLTLLGAKPGPF